MKLYIRGSLTSGLVGIWWIYNSDVVIADARPLDDGFNDGNFVNYDEFKNHSTEWRKLVSTYLPEIADTLIPKGFKSIERGRVVYNLRTMAYEIVCSEKVYKDIEQRKLIVDAFELSNCRYDFIISPHYHIAEITGNPALDQFEYGI